MREPSVAVIPRGIESRVRRTKVFPSEAGNEWVMACSRHLPRRARAGESPRKREVVCDQHQAPGHRQSGGAHDQ